MSGPNTTVRQIEKIVASKSSTDGDGVRIQRNTGQQQHDMDPFLMLDEIRSADAADYIGGFPPHPHRGIETLTYMLSGGFVHEDNMGHREELRDGGAQWMFSGRGVTHSELPLIHEGLLHGFQLWINIPAKHKMDEPVYQQATREELSVMKLADGSTLHAFGGEWKVADQILSSPFKNMSANARTLDVRLLANSKLSFTLPSKDKVLAYVYDGSLAMPAVVKQNNLVYFSNGDQLELVAGGEGVRLLLLAGTPLNEPIAQYGPFVMNTEAEIQQALKDYRSGKF